VKPQELSSLFHDLPQPNRRRFLVPVIDNQFHVTILLRDSAYRGFDLSTVVKFRNDAYRDFASLRAKFAR
jgi:hypothetical protein